MSKYWPTGVLLCNVVIMITLMQGYWIEPKIRAIGAIVHCIIGLYMAYKVGWENE